MTDRPPTVELCVDGEVVESWPVLVGDEHLLVAVDHIARLHLRCRRAGGVIRIVDPSGRLASFVRLVGLATALLPDPGG